MKVIGNEFEIRMMLHSVIWNGSSGQDIINLNLDPSDELKLLKIIGILDCPTINTNELLTLLTVTKLRIEQKFFVKDLLFDVSLLETDVTIKLKNFLLEKKSSRQPFIRGTLFVILPTLLSFAFFLMSMIYG